MTFSYEILRNRMRSLYATRFFFFKKACNSSSILSIKDGNLIINIERSFDDDRFYKQ